MPQVLGLHLGERVKICIQPGIEIGTEGSVAVDKDLEAEVMTMAMEPSRGMNSLKGVWC